MCFRRQSRIWVRCPFSSFGAGQCLVNLISLRNEGEPLLSIPSRKFCTESPSGMTGSALVTVAYNYVFSGARRVVFLAALKVSASRSIRSRRSPGNVGMVERGGFERYTNVLDRTGCRRTRTRRLTSGESISTQRSRFRSLSFSLSGCRRHGRTDLKILHSWPWKRPRGRHLCPRGDPKSYFQLL